MSKQFWEHYYKTLIYVHPSILHNLWKTKILLYMCAIWNKSKQTIIYETSAKDIVGRIGKESSKNCIHSGKQMMHLHKYLNIEHSYDYAKLRRRT